MNEYLQSGHYVDSTHPKVVAFSEQHAKGANDREKAVALYYAVRDRVRYNPFQNFMADDAYRASACLERNVGWCVSKAALLAACARSAGIPARGAAFPAEKTIPPPPAPREKGAATL